MAALLGGLVETFGFRVAFASPTEEIDASLRRLRPRIYIVDCDSVEADAKISLGRALMRRVSVILFGSPPLALEMQEIAQRHDAEVVLSPPEAGALGEALSRAARKPESA